MASLQLDKGTVLFDEKDKALVLRHTWFIYERHGTKYVAANIRIDSRRKQVRMHRFLMDAAPNDIVDHINHNGLDNRRSNLRFVDPVTSNRHRRCLSKNQSSSYKGVSWFPATKKWKACIRVTWRKNPLTIATLAEEKQAARAYDLFCVRYWGRDEYVLNFPELESIYLSAVKNNPDLAAMRRLAKKVGY